DAGETANAREAANASGETADAREAANARLQGAIRFRQHPPRNLSYRRLLELDFAALMKLHFIGSAPGFRRR
ncbi:hypothetical protein, partial [Cohnella thermotolerans]|uniref:hypothetical protein n=1 Tax=Cohnella thermotolerans TaxID=329858 RepID=UPI00146FAE36